MEKNVCHARLTLIYCPPSNHFECHVAVSIARKEIRERKHVRARERERERECKRDG
jgi:hypothetical protein